MPPLLTFKPHVTIVSYYIFVLQYYFFFSFADKSILCRYLATEFPNKARAKPNYFLYLLVNVVDVAKWFDERRGF